jgi:hypothetical protein
MRHCSVFSLLCIFSLSLFAQDVPRGELFVGYSYINADTSGLTSRLNINGGDISFTANFSQWAGAETNFSAYFRQLNFAGIGLHIHDYNIFFGPRVHYKWVFAHALAGLDDFGGSALGGSTTNGAFGSAIGGGATFKITKRIGIEGGGDYVITRHNLLGGSAITQNHVRAIAGVVFTFGRIGATAEQASEPSATPAYPTPTRRAIGAGMKVAALGIMVQMGRTDGAEVTDVAPNGVAALAGMHPGDVINAVDGKPIKTPMELVAELSNRASGDKVRIGYSLHGQWQTETVIVLP